eukprot:TRINITY_DN37991_c0_g1_i1.p2 TRINITY_DN37991_c0_g1~~TRINITY_DN37991_c0_g1_i1.p2  ORF type:complete len:223 (+),score=34.27 TRINITY_DN37991_c0_g1_i1:64-732(+)
MATDSEAGIYGDVCAPQWAKGGQICPHGVLVALPLSDMTRHNNSTFLDNVANVYSAVPLVVIVLMVVALVARRGLRELLMFGLCPVIVDPVTVLLKMIFAQPRPIGSCMTSCGMPSGHSSASISLLVYILLDLASRWKHGERTAAVMWQSIVAAVVLAPVPWSRVQLRDHSLQQVCAGSLLGALVASGYFLAVRALVAPKARGLCERLPLLQDNYSHEKDEE